MQRSYTPTPRPMMSIRISLGLRSYGVASYSALIFPAVAIRSVEFQHFTGSSSLFICRLASAVRSSPKRATSTPQTGALNVGPVERRDERRAQAEKHFAGDAVGFMLKIEYLLEAGLEPVAAGDHFAQGAVLTITAACRSKAGKKKVSWRGINR